MVEGTNGQLHVKADKRWWSRCKQVKAEIHQDAIAKQLLLEVRRNA
jgi:hypothetical protein